MRIWTLVFSILLISCGTTKVDRMKLNVKGFVKTENSDILKLKSHLKNQNHKEFDTLKASMKYENTEEKLWGHYLNGLKLIDQKKLPKAKALYQNIYHKTILQAELSQSDMRVLGLILKKLGWLYRQDKEYEKAYLYHQYRLSLTMSYGSYAEIHDAYLSLDVDSYFLKNNHMSEFFLYESLKYAKQIENEKEKYRAMGMSFNNLSGTLYSLKKYNLAEEKIIQALIHWRKYEKFAGEKENKLIWAYFGVADIYEKWALTLKKSNESPIAYKRLSIEALEKAMKIGKQRKLSEKDFKVLKDALDRVEKI